MKYVKTEMMSFSRNKNSLTCVQCPSNKNSLEMVFVFKFYSLLSFMLNGTLSPLDEK